MRTNTNTKTEMKTMTTTKIRTNTNNKTEIKTEESKSNSKTGGLREGGGQENKKEGRNQQFARASRFFVTNRTI